MKTILSTIYIWFEVELRHNIVRGWFRIWKFLNKDLKLRHDIRDIMMINIVVFHDKIVKFFGLKYESTQTKIIFSPTKIKRDKLFYWSQFD